MKLSQEHRNCHRPAAAALLTGNHSMSPGHISPPLTKQQYLTKYCLAKSFLPGQQVAKFGVCAYVDNSTKQLI